MLRRLPVLFIFLLLLCAKALAASQIMVPIISDATPIGTVALQDVGRDQLRADVTNLEPWLSDNLSFSAWSELKSFLDTDHIVAVGVPQYGITLTYDPQNAILHLDVDPADLKTQVFQFGNNNVTPDQTPLASARLSGYLNMRAGAAYVENGSVDNGRQPAQFDLDGAANLKDWVLESHGAYQEDSAHPWQRDNTRLVHDWPGQMVRLAVGDLAYPVSGFQSYAPLFGVSIARNFSLQPYRVTQPSGNTSFVLKSPSRVDVLINGQKIRTLQLNPGPYDISDFPVADGSNDVTLLITDAAGNVEEKTFPFFSDQKLLKAGLNEYAYNAGIEEDTVSGSMRYHPGKPAFSLFHRYGLSDVFTTGISAQADQNVQQTGLSILNAQRWGTISLEGDASHTRIDTDGAAALSYLFHDLINRRDFSTSLQYRGDHFAVLGQPEALNPSAWEAAARYNQNIFYNISMGFGGRYQFGRGASEDDWSYSVNLSRLMTPALTLTVNGEERRTGGAGLYMNLIWSPPQSHHTVSASIDTLARTQDLHWNWRQDQAVPAFQASAGVTRTDGRAEDTGGLSYTGYRGEAEINHDIASFLDAGTNGQTREESRTQISGGTALAFADGHIAFSRPISDGFVMVARNDNLSAQNIGINSETGRNEKTDYQAVIDGFGPAVLPDATPYMYRTVRVDTGGLPIGYDIGQDNAIALPSYKSGTLLKVGNDANIFADGRLIFADGTPIALQAGTIAGLNDPSFPAQEFFTNALGRFRISRLKPGSYILILYQYPKSPIAMTVPDQSIGKFDAGVLIMPGKIS